MGPVVRLLQAIANLTRTGAIKSVDDAFRLAKRELGDKFDRYKNQIKDAFDAGTRKQKSADIIPFPKKKKEGIETLKKEDDIFEDTLKAAKEMVKEKNLKESPLMKRLEGGVESLRKAGQGENLTTGLTRTLAREILMKRGIDLTKGMDPIEIFRKTFGQDVLGDVSNIADELIEMQAMGRTPKRLEDILEQEGMFDIKMPKEPPQGYTPEEMEEIKKAIEQEDVLLKFDPKDRKPNAEGGLNSLMKRRGYREGDLALKPSPGSAFALNSPEELTYDATDPIYGSSAITVTPDTVMGPGGNQIQDKMGKPGMVSPITGMPLPPGGYEAVGKPYIPPPIETNMPNIDGILPVVPTNPIEKIFQERTFNQVPEEYRSGFAEYVKQNPIGAGGQAMTPVGLPDGGSVMFGDTASAGAFRNYLKSIGVETPNSVPQLAIQQPLIDTKSILQDYGNSDFFSRISTTDVRPFTFGGEEMSGSSTYIGGLRNYLDSIGKSDLLQLPEPQTASLQKQQPLSPLAATAYFSKGGSAKRGLDYLMGM